MARRDEIHLINKFGSAAGGSEWRTLSLYDTLCEHGPVRLWSSRARPDPRLTARYPIALLQPARLRFPRSGVLVFVGVYHRPGWWVALSGARRRVVIYNTVQPRELQRALRRLRAGGRGEVEIVHASEQLRSLSGLPGAVQPSPVDLRRFHPPVAPAARPFTVGRLSRDEPVKHHPDDPALYAQLAAHGCAIRIMGGTVLAPRLCAPGVTLLPACAEDAAEFLRGLDCFVYRTSPQFFEAFGRVICEAMASGLPVVCHRRGGYTEFIEHGRNGFLFDESDEAAALVLQLRDDPPLRERIGRAARASAESIYSAAQRAELLDFYWPGAARS